MERTMEENVERLKELSKLTQSEVVLEQWLMEAEFGQERFIKFHKDRRHLFNSLYQHAQVTWDVHTGVAFTKLYKAMK